MEHLPFELAEYIADHLHAYTCQPFSRWDCHTKESRKDIQAFRQVCRGFNHASAKVYAETIGEKPFRLNAKGIQQLLDLSQHPEIASYITSLTFADELCFHADAGKVFEAARNLTTILGRNGVQEPASEPPLELDKQRERIQELDNIYNSYLVSQESEIGDSKLVNDLILALKGLPNIRSLRIFPEEIDGTLKRIFTQDQYKLMNDIAESPDMPSMSLFPGGHRPDTLRTVLQAVASAGIQLSEFSSANLPGSETLQVIRLDLAEDILCGALKDVRTMRITADSQRAYPSELDADPEANSVRRDALAKFISCAPNLEVLELNAGGALWEFGVERRHFSLRKFFTDVRLPRLRRFVLQGPVLLDNANEFPELQQFLDGHRETLDTLGFHEVETRSSAVAVHCAYCVWTDFVIWLKHFPHLELEVKGVLGSEEFTEMLFSEPLGWIRRAQ